MAAARIAIGEHLYLFTDLADPGTELIISSHGTYYMSTVLRPERDGHGWLRVPAWTTLRFFVVHGEDLAGMSVRLFANLAAREEYNSGDTVRNYALTKYQGRHGSTAETYAAICQDIDANRARRGAGVAIPAFDVLTIRHHQLDPLGRSYFGVRLKFVLDELDRTNHRYGMIRCCFCRSNSYNNMIKAAGEQFIKAGRKGRELGKKIWHKVF